MNGLLAKTMWGQLWGQLRATSRLIYPTFRPLRQFFSSVPGHHPFVSLRPTEYQIPLKPFISSKPKYNPVPRGTMASQTRLGYILGYIPELRESYPNAAHRCAGEERET